MAHEPRRITELFAWICTEPDGGDGVPAIEFPPGSGQVLPLMGSDFERMESLRPWALAVARDKGLPVRLVRFSNAHCVEVL